MKFYEVFMEPDIAKKVNETVCERERESHKCFKMESNNNLDLLHRKIN